MARNQIRIILDTNLWISFLITKNFSQLDELLFKYKARLVFSLELLNEFLEVVKRPKLRKFFNDFEIEELLETIEEHADFVKVVSEIDLCRDEKDNFLLSLAIDSEADYLLTGDQDLLVLKSIGGAEIITITVFFNKLS